MTVQQFETFIQPSFDARQQLEVLDDQRTNLLTTRENADGASLAKATPSSPVWQPIPASRRQRTMGSHGPHPQKRTRIRPDQEVKQVGRLITTRAVGSAEAVART
jgi:hypothetical protein